MIRKFVTASIVAILFVFSHYIHYKINRVRDLFYNTEFSTEDLPVKFYQIYVGEKRGKVESLIGKPLYEDSSFTYYSKRGDEILWNHYCFVFSIVYDHDTVKEKRAGRDD